MKFIPIFLKDFGEVSRGEMGEPMNGVSPKEMLSKVGPPLNNPELVVWVDIPNGRHENAVLPVEVDVLDDDGNPTGVKTFELQEDPDELTIVKIRENQRVKREKKNLKQGEVQQKVENLLKSKGMNQIIIESLINLKVYVEGVQSAASLSDTDLSPEAQQAKDDLNKVGQLLNEVKVELKKPEIEAELEPLPHPDVKDTPLPKSKKLKPGDKKRKPKKKVVKKKAKKKAKKKT